MSLLYLLDTNILSDLINRPGGAAASKLESFGASTACTSVIAACELRFGAEHSESSVLKKRVKEMLATIQVLPLKHLADERYGEIREYLQSNGKIIGPNDLLIAAHALAENLTLVTANVSEFRRVPGLKFENWLE